LDGAGVLIMPTNLARRSTKLKWETVLAWRWANRGRIRDVSLRIGVDRTIEIQVVRTHRILRSVFSVSREALAVLGSRKTASRMSFW
jgi:hypothetical protein